MCARKFVQILVFNFNSVGETSFLLSLSEDLKLIIRTTKLKWLHLKRISCIAECNEGTYKRDEQEKLLNFFKNLNVFIGDMLHLRLYNSLLLHADSYHQQQPCSCWWHKTVTRVISAIIVVTWHEDIIVREGATEHRIMFFGVSVSN